MRKVKFTQDSFDEKLSAILEEFPMLDVRCPSPKSDKQNTETDLNSRISTLFFRLL